MVMYPNAMLAATAATVAAASVAPLCGGAATTTVAMPGSKAPKPSHPALSWSSKKRKAAGGDRWEAAAGPAPADRDRDVSAGRNNTANNKEEEASQKGGGCGKRPSNVLARKAQDFINDMARSGFAFGTLSGATTTGAAAAGSDSTAGGAHHRSKGPSPQKSRKQQQQQKQKTTTISNAAAGDGGTNKDGKTISLNKNDWKRAGGLHPRTGGMKKPSYAEDTDSTASSPMTEAFLSGEESEEYEYETGTARGRKQGRMRGKGRGGRKDGSAGSPLVEPVALAFATGRDAQLAAWVGAGLGDLTK